MDYPIECLVLAGGTPDPDDALYPQTSGGPKASLEIAGQPMVQWVLDALAASDRIGRVVLVGDLPRAQLRYPREIEIEPRGGDWSESFFRGVERLNRSPGRPAAFCWSDIPLLEGEMVDRFLNGVGDAPSLVHAGLVSRDRLESRFGRLDEPYLRFVEGQFVAADFGVFQPAEAARLRPQLEALAPQRKSAIQQARTVGWRLLIRYLLGRLSIADLQQRLERTYQISCRIHVVEDAEMGLDVDGPENLSICRAVLCDRSDVTSVPAEA